MLVRVKQNKESEVELVIEKEVQLKEEYREMTAREMIKHSREKNTLEDPTHKNAKSSLSKQNSKGGK